MAADTDVEEIKGKAISSGFCNVLGCMEFAQSGDPTCENTLKFKCPKHEAEARARGETGQRRPDPPKYFDFSNPARGTPPESPERLERPQAGPAAEGESRHTHRGVSYTIGPAETFYLRLWRWSHAGRADEHTADNDQAAHAAAQASIDAAFAAQPKLTEACAYVTPAGNRFHRH